MRLQTLAENVTGIAKGVIESGCEAVPVFFVVVNDELTIMMCPWQSDEEKRATFHALREKFQEMGATAYVFVCEAWVSKFEKGEEWDGTPPSEDYARRMEVLMVDGNTTDGERYSKIFEIKTVEGKRTVAEMNDLEGHQEGNAVNLLLREGRQPTRQ